MLDNILCVCVSVCLPSH